MARIANSWVDAFNRRDRATRMSMVHADAELRPTLLIGERSVFRGPEGIGGYLDQLVASGQKQQARIRELRRLGSEQFVILTEVLIDGRVVSPGAALVRLRDGKIVEVTAYLTDEATLTSLKIIPTQDAQACRGTA